MPTQKQKEALDKIVDIKKIKQLFKEFDGDYIYLIKCHEFYKVGKTFSLDNRMNSLQCGNPYPLELIWAAKIKDASEVESLLHEKFDAKRYSREWFKLGTEDVEFITNLVELSGNGIQREAKLQASRGS